MVDGTVLVWDVAAILAKKKDGDEYTWCHPSRNTRVAQSKPCSSLVHSIRHNSPLAEPTDSVYSRFGVGRIYEPAEGQQDRRLLVAWNTQVAHILASSSADGSVAVWDLNSRQAWCELEPNIRDKGGHFVNPTVGLHP
jgi:WD40 repeat protein